jgi:type IV pilus assembly protein PilX
VGVSFSPTTTGMPIGATTAYSAPSAAGPNYFGKPTFYISDLGPSIDATVPGEIYQIDAYGYGSSQNTVAVVESTYAVYTSSSCVGGCN